MDMNKKKQLKSGYLTIRAGGLPGSKPIKSNKNMLKYFKDDINFFRQSIDHTLIQVDIQRKTNDLSDKVEGIYTDINKVKVNMKKINVKR